MSLKCQFNPVPIRDIIGAGFGTGLGRRIIRLYNRFVGVLNLIKRVFLGILDRDSDS
jgi:hypothetical protein